MYPHHSLGVGVGIGAGVDGGVGLGLGVGVDGWMLVRASYKRKTNITKPKCLLYAEYNILYRVCIKCTPITHWEWVWALVRVWMGVGVDGWMFV
jgi:hypothetical protein